MIGKLQHNLLWFCGGFILLVLSSCNDFDSFGSDLLNDDWIFAKGDTFSFTAGPAKKDSILTFKNATALSSPNQSGASFPLGKMNDPIFGKVEAGFGTQLRIVATQNVRFLKVPVDSIVLSLRYDTSLFYGKYKEPMDFGVYQLSAAYNSSVSYYSNHVLPYDLNKKLGEVKSYIPNKTDGPTILIDTQQIKLYPQLRIHLDTFAFMSVLRSFSDNVYATVDSFTKAFNGIAVICDNGNGIVSVQPQHGDSKITIYYHDTTTVQSTAEFNMGSLAVKTPYYQIDNQNTIAGNCINGTIPGDSLLCIQGFEGRDIELNIPYDTRWNGKFINFAVLQFYVAELPGDDLSTYTLPGLLEIFDYSSGTLVPIDDVSFGLSSISQYARRFGGNPVKTEINGQTVYSYKMNITRHFQKAQKAKLPIKLVISPLYKLESAARVVFYGNGVQKFPAKLYLTYSE